MFLETLSFQNLRGLELISFKPSLNLNFIVGPNNAGKTTVLESVYILSYSRSFRTVNLDRVISNSQKFFKISSKISDNSLKSVISIEKCIKSPKTSLIDNSRSSTKECLLKAPVISLCFGSENIFNTSGENRRSLIDSGLFHVKHEYMSKLQNYNKLLKSRNRSLKSGDTNNIKYWTELLIDNALVINEYRIRYMDDIRSLFLETIDSMVSVSELYTDIASAEITYSSGYTTWPIIDQYENSLKRDIALGYTTIGPHRGDIIFSIDNIPLKEIASMSTQVILSLCFIISQAKAFHVKHKHYPVVLIDDIFFGIDDKNLEVMIKLLSSSGAQCFLSAPDLYAKKLEQVAGDGANKVFTLTDNKIEENS